MRNCDTSSEFQSLFGVSFSGLTGTFLEIAETAGTASSTDSVSAFGVEESGMSTVYGGACTFIIKYKIEDYPNDSSSAILYEIGGAGYGLVIGFSSNSTLVIYGGLGSTGSNTTSKLFEYDITGYEDQTNIIGFDISFVSSEVADFKLYFNNALVGQNTAHDLSTNFLFGTTGPGFGTHNGNYNKLFESDEANIVDISLVVGSFVGLITDGEYIAHDFYGGDSGLDVSGDVTVDGSLNIGMQTDVVSTFGLLDTSVNTLETITTDISYISGTTTILSNLDVSGGLDVSGDVTVDGSLNIGMQTDVVSTFGLLDTSVNTLETITTDISYSSGTTTILNDLDVSGDVTVDGSLNIGMQTDVVSKFGLLDTSVNLLETDISELDTSVNLLETITTDISYSSGTTTILNDLDVSGHLDVSGDVTVDGSLNIGMQTDVVSKFGLLDASVNLLETITTDISYSSGTTTILSNLDVSGHLDVSGDVTVDGSLNIGSITDVESSITTLDSSMTGVEGSIGNLVASVNILETITTDISYISGITTITGALDISSTDSLLIPRGTTSERNLETSETPGALRFNRDTSLCEVYTQSNIWSGLPVYKAEQPPAMTSISSTPSNQSVTVNWEKFANIYKDAYDGKCYPIFLQTFVDISFSDISGESTGGWKTIRIDNGNYDNNNTETTFLSSITFDGLTGTNYSDTTGYSSIDFTDKPTDTINLPSFTQTDSFDLRVYAVNKSGTTPNYIYISGVGLKTTGAPGEVDVISFDNFLKTSFEIDVSFNLDASNTDVTSGVDIEKYDISFVLLGSKSFKSRAHDGSLNLTGNSPYDMSGISVTGLFPGATYDIQVRAKNAANSSFGSYGDVSTSTGFTQIYSGQYIEYSSSGGDLNSVTPDHMTFILNKTKSIYGYASDETKLSNNTITNENGYITFSNESEFYVNYAKQGIDMSGAGTLVQATVDLSAGSNSYSQTITYNGTDDPSGVSAESIDISNGNESASLNYQFTSGGAYTDKKIGTSDDRTIGFVYSSTFDNSNNTTEASLNDIFVQNFPASTDSYELNYTITGTMLNGESSNSSSNTTGSFYVDDYYSTPDITWNTDPYLTVDSSSSLFGIPSVLSIRLQGSFDVSGFASYIIPHSNNTSYIHSYVSSMTDVGYSFGQVDQTDISNTNTYTFNGGTAYNQTADINNSGTYNSSPSIDFSANVYYLGGNSGSDGPTLERYEEGKNVTIGSIFRDSVTEYSGYDLYLFDSVNSVLDNQITNFTETPSDISTTLLYFDGKFVSGGYTNSNSVSPFSDWSSGYAEAGPNYVSYSNTGLNYFKWIAIDVTSKKLGSNVDLAGFKINDSSPDISKFGTFTDVSGYEAYIYHGGKFGALKGAHSSGATSWFLNDTYYGSISSAKSSSANGALQSSSDSGTIGVDAFIDEGDSSDIYLIVGLPQNANSYFSFS